MPNAVDMMCVSTRLKDFVEKSCNDKKLAMVCENLKLFVTEDTYVDGGRWNVIEFAIKQVAKPNPFAGPEMDSPNWVGVLTIANSIMLFSEK